MRGDLPVWPQELTLLIYIYIYRRTFRQYSSYAAPNFSRHYLSSERMMKWPLT